MRFIIKGDPPGINATYQIGRNRKTKKGFLFKSENANEWAASAALQIGAQAALQNWEDATGYYQVMIVFTNLNLDIDAPVKLILDTLSQKLSFNDKRIMKLCIEKIHSGNDEAVIIEITPYECC